jgi:hypothetical protein
MMTEEQNDSQSNLELLEHFKNSSNDMIEQIKKERLALKNYIETRNRSAERICLRNAGLEGNIDEFYESIDQELAECEQSQEQFLKMMNEKLNYFSKNQEQGYNVIKEVISVHVNLVSSLALALQKIEDLKNIGKENNIEILENISISLDDENKNISFEKFLKRSNTRKADLEKHSSKFIDIQDTSEVNLENKIIHEINESQNYYNEILKKEEYYWNVNIDEILKNFVSFADIYKSKINKEFLHNLRVNLLAYHELDYKTPKELWYNKIKANISQDPYFFIEMTLVSDNFPFPSLSFMTNIKFFFEEYFVRFEANKLKVMGRTIEKNDFIKVIQGEKFRNDFNLKSLGINIFSCIEDLVINNFQQLEAFHSNIDKQEVYQMKEAARELVILKKALAYYLVGKTPDFAEIKKSVLEKLLL